MPNALAHAQSPYLLQHAHNPVDWLQWGEEAFKRARATGRPIFLSIGYSTCHWCHVMAHESFEDEAVAAQLNRDFVCIKIDREERPDVDRVYMTYVQALSGHGGWPLSVWLTPELVPFYGGTYFPPDDRHGRPSFSTILNSVAKAWVTQRERLIAEATRTLDSIRDQESGAGRGNRGSATLPADAELADAGSAAFEQAFLWYNEAHDAGHGGFGGAPKFPRAGNIEFLFRAASLQGVTSEVGVEAFRMAEATLRAMALGGIHDHLGGGFHRYSVDEEWHVPHFEKMLYDQAQIAVNYLDACTALSDPRYPWIVRGIIDYVARDMTHPEGAFYAAEDADSLLVAGESAHAEGAFYVWTAEQVAEVVAAAEGAGVQGAALAAAHFDVHPGGNVAPGSDPHGEFTGKNVLRQRRPLAATAQSLGLAPSEAEERLLAAITAMRTARESRPRPHRDEKLITAWNGLMIAACARAHAVLGLRADADADERTRYRRMAERAAGFLQRNLWDEQTGTLYRSWLGVRAGIPAFAADYASLTHGLLELHAATLDVRWLQWAEQLQDRLDALCWDGTDGGYFDAPAGDGSLVLRLKEDYDGAEPAPSSLAAGNLFRLAALLHRDDLHARGVRCVEAFRSRWSATPHALPVMLGAIEYAVMPPRHVVIAGDPAAEDTRALLAIVHERLGPRRHLLGVDGGQGQAWLATRAPWLTEMRPMGGRATAYVCERFTCSAPVTVAAELRDLLG